MKNYTKQALKNKKNRNKIRTRYSIKSVQRTCQFLVIIIKSNLILDAFKPTIIIIIIMKVFKNNII